MNDRVLLTAHVIGREFAREIQRRIGGEPHVTCELVQRPDSFGPVNVIEVCWNGFTAHLNPARAALSLSLEDYSRHFVQPVIESWLADLQQLARTA